jgi:AcrR family transcriptional regulator
MARPRYGEGDARARERIVDAFWEMLGEMPYEQMRVLALCRRAGLNKNTFYYHFEGMPSLANAAIDGIMFQELAQTALHGTGSGGGPAAGLRQDKAARARFGRLGILLSDNGAALQGMLADRIANVWLEELGATADELPARQALYMAYASGGIVNVLRHRSPLEYEAVLTTLGESDTMRDIVREVMGRS